MADENHVVTKRRKNGSFRNEQKKLKTKGLSYKTITNKDMPAKKLPSTEVRLIHKINNRWV